MRLLAEWRLASKRNPEFDAIEDNLITIFGLRFRLEFRNFHSTQDIFVGAFHTTCLVGKRQATVEWLNGKRHQLRLN